MRCARLAARLASPACSLLLAACASFTPGNPPLAKYAPDAGYRFERLERGDNSDELFVIVTFSGGGTRAAALAYGVLEALRDTTIEWRGRRMALLDEVDVISSISGGSFPAAYYALRGRQIFDEFPDRFLYRPVQNDLIKRALSPSSWLKLAASDFGRSDLAAEFYHREVFAGRHLRRRDRAQPAAVRDPQRHRHDHRYAVSVHPGPVRPDVLGPRGRARSRARQPRPRRSREG